MDVPMVLMVEDDAPIAAMYRMRLEIEGWSVSVAGDGGSAVEMALSSPPSVIVLDMMLPVVDGLGVLSRLREAGLEVPVLMLSNSAGLEGRRAQADELGAAAWLTKSQTTPGKLVDRVREVLDQTRG